VTREKRIVSREIVVRQSPGFAYWTIALLALAGIGMSTYLLVAYLQEAAPVCGGLGGCAEVEHSEYARLLGVPIPLFGVLVYAGILALTGVRRWLGPAWAAYDTLAIFLRACRPGLRGGATTNRRARGGAGARGGPGSQLR